MVQNLLAERVFADPQTAFAAHIAYIFVSYVLLLRIGFVLRGPSSPCPLSRWVVLFGWTGWTLAALLLVANATQMPLWSVDVDFIWLSLSTLTGFFMRHNRYFKNPTEETLKIYAREWKVRLQSFTGWK